MTHAGAVFKHHVDAMMHELDDGLAAVSQVVDPATGTVTLAFQPSLGTWLVPHLISSFRAEHPNVRFDLRPKRDELTTAVQHRSEIDLELSTLRPYDPSVEWTRLTRETLKLAVPHDHQFAARSTIKLAEAATEQFVGIAATSVLHRQSAELCREAGFEPAVGFVGHDLAAVHGFVAAGLGVAIVPAMRGGLSEETFGAVRLLDISDVLAFREIGLGWSTERRMLPAAELFRAHVLKKARAGHLRTTEPIGTT
jgi:DNA-binding transcriptional LysR family regulator